MRALYFGIVVTVLCELGQLALIGWNERSSERSEQRLLIVERADLEAHNG